MSRSWSAADPTGAASALGALHNHTRPTHTAAAKQACAFARPARTPCPRGNTARVMVALRKDWPQPSRCEPLESQRLRQTGCKRGDLPTGAKDGCTLAAIRALNTQLSLGTSIVDGGVPRCRGGDVGWRRQAAPHAQARTTNRDAVTAAHLQYRCQLVQWPCQAMATWTSIGLE